SGEQLALVDDDAGELAAINTQRDAALNALQRAAKTLTKRRQKASEQLAAEVTALLPDLGMPHGKFEVLLESLDEPGAHGAEAVRFRATLNPGTEPRAIDRIASGGELSRLMLALSTVLARLQQVPTLVFD